MTLSHRMWLKRLALLLISLSSFFLTDDTSLPPDSPIVSLSMSADGRYVVTAQANGHVTLFDIEHGSQARLTQHARPATVKFIHDTHVLVWQNTHNTVLIKTINDQLLDAIHLPMPLNNLVMTADLQQGFFVDQQWNLFHLTKTQWRLISPGHVTQRFMHLQLSADDKYLVTAGFDHFSQPNPPSAMTGAVLWTVADGTAKRMMQPHDGMVFATISPDSRYTVSGDENGHSYLWHNDSGQMVLMHDDLLYGRFVDQAAGERAQFDNAQRIAMPIELRQIALAATRILAYQFITQDTLLRIMPNLNYVLVYSSQQAYPNRYIKLASKDGYFPSTAGFASRQTIDASASAGRITFALAGEAGIIVYQYKREIKSLAPICTLTIHK